MNYYGKHITLVILVLGGYMPGIFAQQTDNTLLMFGESNPNVIRVQWQPMNPVHWDALNKIGYRVERVELDAQNTEIFHTNIVLAGASPDDLMLPKDELWFSENALEFNGLIGAMGTLLYDTTFQFPGNKLLNATEMRYSWLLYEAQWKPLAGEALGLMWSDSTVTASKKYRYKVSAVLPDGTTLSNNLDFTAGETVKRRNPEDMFPKYDFPTRMPLSMMINMQIKKRRDQIIAQARAYEDSVVLRWAPNGANFWLEANETGYFVIREGGGSRDTLKHVLPWAKEDLNESLLNDDMALIAANNLHGNNAKKVEGDFIEKANIFESRYGFSLFAAERSPLAAEVLGLRFVDKNVEKDKSYQYKIVSPSGNNLLAAAKISVTNTYTPQPPPINVKLISGDQYILLEWGLENQQRFSSYILERSDDGGKTFFPLTEEPLVFLETEEFPLKVYNFLDSVKVNYVEFVYRLSGNDGFAETSQPIELRGMAVDLTPPPQPSILIGELNETRDTIEINWASPFLADDFAGYQVLFGSKKDGDFEPVTGLLPPEIQSYVYTSETLDGRQSHYFKIAAIDTAQNVNTSLPYYVFVPDLIPPEPPAKVEGVIEDDGTVHLAWEHSTSDDVEGYWVYFSNLPTNDFAVLNEQPITQNYYSYKIQEKFLNETIYYVIAAKDEQGNRSRLTEIYEAKRPDKVPPQKPRMLDVKAEEDVLLVTWAKSVSKDVEQYLIFKKESGTNEGWFLADSIPGDAEPIYRDENCEIDKYYEYQVQAKDDAGHLSELPLPLNGILPFKPELFVVKELTVKLNKEKSEIQLEWTYDPPNLKGWDYPFEFYIYKSIGKNNVDSYQLLTNDQLSFSDTDFVEGSLCNYAVKIQFGNGRSGALSSVKSVLIR